MKYYISILSAYFLVCNVFLFKGCEPTVQPISPEQTIEIPSELFLSKV